MIKMTVFLIHSLNSIHQSVRWRQYISLLHFKNSKIQFHEVPPLYYALVCKIYTYLYVKDDTFKPVTMEILFYVKFANFWYITSCVPNLIPIWLQYRGL